MNNINSRSVGAVSGLVAFALLALPLLPAAVAASYTLKVEVTITSEFEYFEGYEVEVYDEDENGNPIEEAEYIPTKADMASAIVDCKAGYNDYKIRVNSAIKVNNESGKVVGLGKLNTAKVVQDPEMDSSVYQCKYFGIVKVSPAKFYKLLIDGRNGPDYSFAELKRQKWTVKLSI